MVNKYPYTDFHELNLDWFLEEFKKVTDHVTTLDETVQEFTAFVTNYFDNLDVQQEINNKLDQMYADGSLSALIQPLFNTYKTEIDGIVATQNNTISEQNQSINTQNGKIAVLQGRMDAFSSLTEGSTTGDAELQDIRVGANGTVYPTAGDAVRGQVETINKSLNIKSGVLPTNSDVNDIDSNSTYWLNQTYSYSNLPTGMTNGIIITTLPYTSSTNIRLQLAYDNVSYRMWYRYRTSGGWNTWRKQTIESDLESAVRTLDTLPSGTDFNSVVSNSIYRITNNNNYTNLPDEISNSLAAGSLITMRAISSSSNGILQLYNNTITNNLYYRIHSSSTWENWICFAKRDELPYLSNIIENATYTDGYSINSDGSISANSYFKYSSPISVKKYREYTFYAYGANATTSLQIRIHAYDGNGDWVKQLASSTGYIDGERYVLDFNTEGYETIKISVRNSSRDLEMIEGSIDSIYAIKKEDKNLAMKELCNVPHYVYGKNILLGGASIVQGYGGTGYAMDGDVIIDISDTPEGQAYSTGGLWKRNTSGYCWANLFKALCENEYNATVDNNACAGTDIGFWAKHADVLIPSGYDLFIYTHSSNDRNYAPETARNRIRSGLKTLKRRCDLLGTDIIVLSPPPASKANEDTKATKTWQCAEFIKEACADYSIKYLDIQDEVIRYYYDHGAASAGTYVDGLHPDDTMYYHMYFCYCWLLNVSPTTAYEQPPV